jgi:hypothetical protein
MVIEATYTQTVQLGSNNQAGQAWTPLVQIGISIDGQVPGTATGTGFFLCNVTSQVCTVSDYKTLVAVANIAELGAHTFVEYGNVATVTSSTGATSCLSVGSIHCSAVWQSSTGGGGNGNQMKIRFNG